MGLSQQFRIFVYDPNVDEGVFKGIADLWADSEKAALLQLQSNTSRKMTLAEKDGVVAMNSDGLQFIARAHSDKQRWPKEQTGRLPQSENQTLREEFQEGRV